MHSVANAQRLNGTIELLLVGSLPSHHHKVHVLGQEGERFNAQKNVFAHLNRAHIQEIACRKLIALTGFGQRIFTNRLAEIAATTLINQIDFLGRKVAIVQNVAPSTRANGYNTRGFLQHLIELQLVNKGIYCGIELGMAQEN